MAIRKVREDILTASDMPEERKRVVVIEVAVTAIKPNPKQTRSEYDEQKMLELTTSIQEHGVLQALTVEKSINGYQIVYGHRRWIAAGRAGLETVPCVVRTVLGDKDRIILSLSENVIRDDMPELDCGRAYLSLQSEHGMTQTEIAKTIGVNQSTIQRAMALAKAPDPVVELLETGAISPAAARQLASAAKAMPGRFVAALTEIENGNATTAKEIERIVTPKRATAAKNDALVSAIRIVNKALSSGNAKIEDGKVVAT